MKITKPPHSLTCKTRKNYKKITKITKPLMITVVMSNTQLQLNSTQSKRDTKPDWAIGDSPTI